MQIRFQRLTPYGSVQFSAGQVIDLPKDLANAFVTNGAAKVVPKSERAMTPHTEAPLIPNVRRPERAVQPR